MKNWIKLNQVPYLFGAVCLGLFLLIVFQISWLSQSRELIEEQFDQKVGLAIGNALVDFNDQYGNNLAVDDAQSCNNIDTKYIEAGKKQVTSEQLVALEEMLVGYMACYDISEDYTIQIVDDVANKSVCAYTCSVNALKSCCSNYALGISFNNKDRYLFDKMKFMVGSSILIFLFLATVSFFILNALIKQKRITENNIDFFNNAAHELKTPLTNISLALTLLTRKFRDIKEDKYVDIIKRENSKLKEQIERVLFLSKMENGEYVLKREPVCLKKIIADVITDMQMMIEEKNGQVELNINKNIDEVLGDAYHLGNVFRNLIDNALKYCDENPVIQISLKQEGNAIKAIVSDNGIGISKHDQVHIFQKFQRVNTGDVQDATGFGIGLSYVKTVIELHKGVIKVLSELNKGSQFVLTIPNN